MQSKIFHCNRNFSVNDEWMQELNKKKTGQNTSLAFWLYPGICFKYSHENEARSVIRRNCLRRQSVFFSTRKLASWIMKGSTPPGCYVGTVSLKRDLHEVAATKGETSLELPKIIFRYNTICTDDLVTMQCCRIVHAATWLWRIGIGFLEMPLKGCSISPSQFSTKAIFNSLKISIILAVASSETASR